MANVTNLTWEGDLLHQIRVFLSRDIQYCLLFSLKLDLAKMSTIDAQAQYLAAIEKGRRLCKELLSFSFLSFLFFSQLSTFKLIFKPCSLFTTSSLTNSLRANVTRNIQQVLIACEIGIIHLVHIHLRSLHTYIRG
jgi:hypothetical protein